MIEKIIIVMELLMSDVAYVLSDSKETVELTKECVVLEKKHAYDDLEAVVLGRLDQYLKNVMGKIMTVTDRLTRQCLIVADEQPLIRTHNVVMQE